MKLSTLSSLGFSTLVLGLVQTPAVGVTIDLFENVNDTSLEQSVYINRGIPPENFPEDSDTNLPLEKVIGRSRHMKISIDPTDSESEAIFTVDANPGNNFLDLTTGTDVISTGTVVWNGLNTVDYNNLSGELNADLTQNGDNSFNVAIKFTDLNGTLKFTVSDGINTGSLTKSIPLVPMGSSSQNLVFRYSDFSNNVDFSSIDYIAMEATSNQAAYDLTLDFVETAEVPFEFSPALGIILSSGFFGFHALKKRWKNNSSDKLIS
jgi:hypothetical protein